MREATPRDAPGVAVVQVETWRATYRGIVPDPYLAAMSYAERARRWQAWHGDPAAGYGLFVAEADDGRIVGFAAGGPDRGAHPRYRGELYAIYVLPEHQRGGRGRRLTAAVVDRLIAAGLPAMRVWVLAANPCRRFYERLGGQPAGARDIGIGGVTLQEVAYAWQDLTALRAALR